MLLLVNFSSSVAMTRCDFAEQLYSTKMDVNKHYFFRETAVCPFSPYTYIPNWSKSLDSPAAVTACTLWMWSSTVVTSLLKNHLFLFLCYSQILAGFLKVKKKGWHGETIPDFNTTLPCPICSLPLGQKKKKRKNNQQKNPNQNPRLTLLHIPTAKFNKQTIPTKSTNSF